MKRLGGFVPAFGVSRARLVLLCQLLATAAALGWVPGNPAKLMTMLVIWGLGFGRIRAGELLAMGAVNLLFVLMNSAALKRGIFGFDRPDFLEMPVYEYLMWGFYTLHTIRFLDGEEPRGGLIPRLGRGRGFRPAICPNCRSGPAARRLGSRARRLHRYVSRTDGLGLCQLHGGSRGADRICRGGRRAVALSRQALRRRPAVVSDDVGRGRLVYTAPDPAAAAAVARRASRNLNPLAASAGAVCRRNVVAGWLSVGIPDQACAKAGSSGIRHPVSVMISPSSG